MKKIVLKETRYNNLPDAIISLLFFLAIIALLLFDVLSGENRIPNSTLIGCGIVCTAGLVILIWNIFAQSSKKKKSYININGWRYRFFQRFNKWTFIWLSGLISAARLGLLVALLMSFSIKNDMTTLQIILSSLLVCIVLSVPYGLINYKVCSLVKLDSNIS